MNTAPKLKFIKQATVRRLAKQYGKRCGRDFLIALDKYVAKKIEDCSSEHNGGKKTLGVAIASLFLPNDTAK